MTQEEVLKKIIEDNRNTEFGREHNFDMVKCSEDYAHFVPSQGYDYYKSFIDRMKSGEKNVLTAYPLACILLTSGSSGNPKTIPLTETAVNQYSSLIFDNLIKRVPKGPILHTSVFRYSFEEQKRKDPPESNFSLLSSFYFGYLAETGAMDLKRFVGGKDLNFSNEIHDVMFVKVWAALYEKDIVGIQSIFLYDTLILFDYLHKNGLSIINCMKSRVIPEGIQISDAVRKYLLENMIPDDDRVAMLEEALAGDFSGIAKKLWPNLTLVSGISGAFFESREAILRGYLGIVPIHYFAFVSSECMSGIALEGSPVRYRLISDNGFFEFAEIDDYGDNNKKRRKECSAEKIYNCTNVPIGVPLELIITNWSGLYRYRSKDIIVVDGFEDGMPVFRYINRIHLAMNVAGEKTSEEMLCNVLSELEQKFGLKMFERSVWADDINLPARYLLLLEPEDSNVDADELAREFDLIMRKVNPDYDDLRNLMAIDQPIVKILRKGSHAKKRQYSSQAKPSLIGNMGKVFDYSEDLD